VWRPWCGSRGVDCYRESSPGRRWVECMSLLSVLSPFAPRRWLVRLLGRPFANADMFLTKAAPLCYMPSQAQTVAHNFRCICSNSAGIYVASVGKPAALRLGQRDERAWGRGLRRAGGLSEAVLAPRRREAGRLVRPLRRPAARGETTLPPAGQSRGREGLDMAECVPYGLDLTWL